MTNDFNNSFNLLAIIVKEYVFQKEWNIGMWQVKHSLEKNV